MTIKKLNRMPYAQAHVEIDNEGNIFLFSYFTLVASLDSKGWFEVYGLFSMTTRKHIDAFMKEYVKYPNGESGDYTDAKRCFDLRQRLNIYTGEIEDIY